MCGISGIYNIEGGAIKKCDIEKMGKTLNHRGPDNFSIFIKGNLAFAHNRLSIVDLSDAGNQPFTNERFSLIYNGEIYNYLELKKELVKFNIKFQSSCDTEVLFYSLIHLGIDFTLRKIKGMYAFAFFDSLTKELILARDRYGIKPLFLYEKSQTYYFASEVKAILKVVEVKPDPVQTLFSITGGAEGSPTTSIFKAIKSIRPGTYLKIPANGELRESSYFNLADQFDEYYFNELSRMSRTEVDELFSHLLQQSVRAMLLSDAPMGTFVSGGVDSSVIAALAYKYKKLDLFTANVLGESSEIQAAQLLSKTLGAPLHVYDYEPQTFLRDLTEATIFYECPIVSFANAIPFSNVAKLAREKGVKAVLTGEGADELFHGYPHLLPRKFSKALLLPMDLLKIMYRVVPGLSKYLNLNGGKSLSDFLELLVRNFNRQNNRAKFFSSAKFIGIKDRGDYFATISMFDSHLLGILHRNDRMGMMASIESRFPFLDEEMVRFGINLPVKFKYQRSWKPYNHKHPFIIDKAPIRHEAKRGLPTSLAEKKKWGFGVKAHQSLTVKPGFFENGYVSEICSLNRGGAQFMVEEMPQYYVGKLVSVEIFGRLFDYGINPSAINDHLNQYVSMI